MENTAALAGAAERLRERGGLDRSGVLTRLFDYLLDAAGRGAPPKETEIAIAVFGRSADVDLSQDASVRVAIHRLRKKLESFYLGPGRDEPVRLALPRGGYNLVLESNAPEPPRGEPELDEPASARRRWRLPRLSWPVLAAITAANLIVLAVAGWLAFAPRGELAAVRRMEPWAAVTRPERTTLLVVGDFYIFAETDPTRSIDRLIREYTINSREDLDVYIMANPELYGIWRDLDLHYVPTSLTLALRELLPVLDSAPERPRRLRVMRASLLTPTMLRDNDIVYLGYLSSLGPLRERVFAGSRFAVGETYDELIDTRTGRKHRSEEGGPRDDRSARHDLGYLAAFNGPSGNRIVVVAGARDVGLMEMAETATRPEALRALRQSVGDAEAFEALYEVEGVGRLNIGAELIAASPLKAERIWEARPQKPFPDG